MRKTLGLKGFAVGVILLFVGTSINPSTAQNIEKSSQSASRGSWLYVGGSGPGNYTKIQDAIDNASDGDTVFVFNGIYLENVVIRKAINVIGEDRNTTIIDGKESGNVIRLVANGIEVTGFTIQNCTNAWYYAGIQILTNYNTISNNIILTNTSDDVIRNDGIDIIGRKHNSIIGNIIFNQWEGIYLEGASFNTIVENHIFKTIHGIYAYGQCNNNTITGNNISDIINNNIYLEEQSNNCLISHNYLNVGTEAILVYHCDNITIVGNKIWNAYNSGIDISGNYPTIANNTLYNDGFAISMFYGYYPTIINNTIISGSVGIDYEDGSYGNISYNRIGECGSGMQIVSPGKFNLVFNNEFRANSIGLYTDVKYGTVKISYNNFINNSWSITFQQTLPIRRQTPRNPIFVKNYYDDWRGIGPKVIMGLTLIFVIPPIPFYGIPIFIPGVYCDWHPAQEPYDIGWD
jgi:nitrous oxidase accessory protein